MAIALHGDKRDRIVQIPGRQRAVFVDPERCERRGLKHALTFALGDGSLPVHIQPGISPLLNAELASSSFLLRPCRHCDLKPENLLLASPDDDTSIRIADFGLAGSVRNGLLIEGCGTPSYMAPEIWRGKPFGKVSPGII